MSFSIGQRWISHADLELGLGICVEATPEESPCCTLQLRKSAPMQLIERLTRYD